MNDSNQTKLQQCLEGKQESCILPFLWLHGEPKERVYEEILAIRNSGARQFCAESRPYEGFCGEQWWEDFGFILESARALGMRVWLLDDRHFPTGYANGYLEAPERAHLRKKLIRERQTEVLGPMKRAKIYAEGWLKAAGETILRVLAYRHEGRGERLDYRSAVDLTDRLRDGMVEWDIPEGVWRVCVLIGTHYNGKPQDRKNYYIDMLDPASCQAMLEAIYEPHYAHFKEYFGNTFAGFFSDEPGFLNRVGSYRNTTGIMFESYPWRADLPRLIAQSAGMTEEELLLVLPALWEDLGEITAAVRMHYMEVITKLYRENFGYLLGDWCRAHGVQYIGHVIEDNGAHMRMGYGAGHFFRALDGQDMAGIDVVLFQDIPGITEGIHRASLTDGGAADPAFFRYTMPKLAASHAHIQPLKRGRAMCEIFGAFGWACGLPYMKGLADVMLASGINHFVPHAFSPKEEDPDCPPHFYNGGKNVQYPLFGNLMGYMERCAHLLRGGLHCADVALFYNAEGEWTGGRNREFSELCRELTTQLIDFDILPYDVLGEAEVREGALWVNGERYGALIISESEILPFDRLVCFDRLARAGLPVLFTEALPVRSAEGHAIEALCAGFETVPTSLLASRLRDKGLCHVGGEGTGLEHLRFYHVREGDTEIYLFSNEDIRHDVDAVLTLPVEGDCLLYEPWENRCYRGRAEKGRFPLRLEKGNLLFAVFGGEIPEGLPVFRRETARVPFPLRFEVATREEGERDFTVLATDAEPFDLSASDQMPRFSGEIRYRCRLRVPEGYTVLDLGEVGEVAEAYLNGVYLGARINAPYKFSLEAALRPGENELEILVRSNLAHRRRDPLSRFIQIPPTGLVSEPSLCRYEEMYFL